MNLKLIAISILSALAFTYGANAGDPKKIRIGTEGAYPPFNQINADGALSGFDIELARALCSDMKVECEFVTQDWDGIIPGLITGKFDAIVASMSITAERAQKVAFTDSYYRTPKYFIAAKDTGMTDTSVTGMKGKVIGAQSSTAAANYLQDLYRESDVRLYEKLDDATLDLHARRIDAILGDGIVLAEWLKKAGKECCAVIGERVENVEYFGAGIGIAVRKDSEDLRQKLNASIKHIRSNGEYAKINARYFGFDIF
ncbi:transporter substrate-binding domain-containing protein [Phyllobacterium calauticae]|jgi:lysine-arginine-ornithine-binding protein|uniref:transporter substrate-binding domain-containing protein n=1 Tax=Phyllobacterium calauticae TaxID=2817027 RepID=UPI001CBAB09A|nr:transporter substrate-binding domain-containing protein [Phyllobacterium calauticae]MBZ3691425.1 transporter substrate-binding domain-containing protein [Phyllobacterium calauticae]